MNDDFEGLFNILFEDNGESTYDNNVRDINKKYKITLSKTSPSNYILKRANNIYEKYKDDLIKKALNGKFSSAEYLATKLPDFIPYVNYGIGGSNFKEQPVKSLPSRSREAIELLQRSPHSWLESIKLTILKRLEQLEQPIPADYKRKLDSVLLPLNWHINDGKHQYERLILAAQKVEESKSRKGAQIIYADHCRYVRSPLSGNRYLMVGINPISRHSLMYVSRPDRVVKRHWTFNLRDFYTPPRSSGSHLRKKVLHAPKYEHIFTIKAENVGNITKQFE